LNPERIVIGGIYMRQHQVLVNAMRTVLQRETLPYALSVCKLFRQGWGNL
jgi:hypothetical protein